MDLFATKFFEATLEPRFRKFLVDLGCTNVNYPTTGNWNNLMAANNTNMAGYNIQNIIDTDGVASTIGVNVVDNLIAVQDPAYNTTVNDAMYPWSALRDGFNTPNGSVGTIILAGVSATKQYRLRCLSGRHTLTATTRMVITVDIDGAQVVLLDQQISTKNNITNLFETADFTVPGIDKIKITITGVGSGAWINVIELWEYI